MKNLLFTIFISFITLHWCLAQSWSWETTFPNSTLNDMKTLPSGTTYLVGDFKQVTPKDSASAADYFLIKVDSSGNIIGGFKKGTDDLGIGQLLGIDNEGNVYVLGTPFVPVANNYYLHKYTVEGSLVWVRRFFMEGGIKAMDVNYGRVALTGQYKKVMRIYDFDKVTITKNLGEYCDPKYQFPCRYDKFDAFVANFTNEGAFVWADNYYAEMQSGYVQEENYYFTKYDYNDYGVDISIDKDQNTIFQGLFSDQENWPPYMIIGSIRLPFGSVDNWPFTIAKFDPTGQPLWAFIEKNGISYLNPNKRISTDQTGNIFQLQEHMGNVGVGILMYKRKPNGSVTWQKVIELDTDVEFWLDNWTWYPDSLGNSYIYADFSSYSERLFLYINKDGALIKQFPNPEEFASSRIGMDNDQNLYFQKGSNLEKYIVQSPTSFTFTGNGIWSNPDNWKDQLKPENELRKWDSLFIKTFGNDSCLLDVPITFLPGANIIVQEGSRFIVPGNIQSDPFPTPITSIAAVNSPALPGEEVLLTIQVAPGKYPTSTAIEAIVDLTSIGGPLAQALNNAGMYGDLVAGDSMFSVMYTLPDSVSPGQKVIPYKVWDAQARQDSGLMILTVSQVKGSTLVISQIYYAGGLTGATYQNDYVELFNRGNTTMSLEGKSLQYASATGTDLFSAQSPVLLSGNLQPGQYYLVSLAAGANGVPLPQAPDATGNFNLSETGGKLVLVNDVTGLPCNGSSTPCNNEQKAKIIDLAGYGNANYFETGVVPTLLLPKQTVLQRNWEGAQDTDNNSKDFYPAMPTPRNKLNALTPVHSKVVISQVYTNGGETYSSDYVELYNAGNLPQSLTGWTLQYADTTSSNWQATPLSGTIQPGQYLLIRQAVSYDGGGYLPQTDLQGTVQMSTTGGKLILSGSNTLLSGNCPTGETIMDKVGYGQTDCFEGSGPVINTQRIIRQKSGGLDTDNNQQDFFEGTVFPRNSQFAAYHTIYRYGESILADTRDGKIYPVKRIGNRVWMLENLNYNATGSKVYNDDNANATIYGRMYRPNISPPNMTSVNGVPSGWRLPSVEDWQMLVAMVGTAGNLKDTLYWQAPNTGGTNSSGFDARPAGIYGGYNYNYDPYIFKDLGKSAYFATNFGERYGGERENTKIIVLGYQSTNLSYETMDRYYLGEEFWISVRCVKD
jgi:uncharacterized protein (TIGR02145 family)